MTTTPTTDTIDAADLDADGQAIADFVACTLRAEQRVIERLTGQRISGGENTDYSLILDGLAYLAAKRLGIPDFTYDDAQQLTNAEQMAVIRATPAAPPADRPAKVAQLLADPRVQAAMTPGE